VVFLATFTNNPMMPVTVTEFSVTSFDGTFTIAPNPTSAPYIFTFTDLDGNSSGAVYSLGITHANNNYTVRLEVTAGVDLLIGSNDYTFAANTSSGTLSNVATLTVNELPEVFVDSPLSGTITTCVRQPITNFADRPFHQLPLGERCDRNREWNRWVYRQPGGSDQ